MAEQKPTPQINDLIFKELIKRGYALEGKTRVWNIADSKLWYLTPEQAEAYLEAVEKAPDYKRAMIDSEINLLNEAMPEIAKKVVLSDELIMIDIGCGDGKKAIMPIQYLKKKFEKKIKIVYCPVDISSYMVQKAIDKINALKEVDEIIRFQWNISDFENLENVTTLLRRNGEELFLLFLGGTLGNFELHESLYAITDSMTFGDSLLIGVALNNNKIDPEKIAEAYKTKEADFFLGKVLEQLGFARNEIEFNARFRNSRVECFYTIKNKKEIKFQNKQINFDAGDQINVSYSYKYNERQFEEAIRLYFKNYKFFFNKERTWALILCKK
jgi:uncharacterized SAM-dependent methyltransferase